jgi:hypothetical protein
MRRAPLPSTKRRHGVAWKGADTYPVYAAEPPPTIIEGGCAMSQSLLNDIRSEALFTSPLQQADESTPAEVRAAVSAAVRTFGTRGCAARMAQEFGDHPDTAMARMCWARRLVAEVYAVHGAAPRLELIPSGSVDAPAAAVARAA